jgi:hypothetical protein
VLRIDHVVLCVRDLDVAGDRLLRDHGLASVPGGRHGEWGTGNRIVPLGEGYVELLGVVDPEAANGSAFGRRMLELTSGGDRWFAICVADDGLDATAARLGLAVVEGSRTRPDGTVVGWRTAGLEHPRREPWLPFFIEWLVPPELHPGATPTHHPSGADGIARVDAAGDPAAFRDWVGGADLPVRFTGGGPPGIQAVALRAPGGEIVLG